VLFAGVFKQMFIPDLSMGWQITLGIALTWIAVLVNVVTLDVGKWVPNAGAVLKVLIFLALILGAFNYIHENGLANSMAWDDLKPDWGSSLQYIPAIIYGMLGFELVSAGSKEMTNPARDVPRAVFISGIIILLLYILGTLAVLAAIPVSDINLVEGLVDTLTQFFGGSALGEAFVILLGSAAIFTFFSNSVTWALGCNRASAEAAMEGELPSVFAIESKTRGTPVGSAVLMGLVSTTTLLLYGFLSGSNEDLFWSLFTFSAVIFLLPYEGMVLAFLKMRQEDPDHPRPFQIPFGLPMARLCAWTCETVLALSIVLFMFVPGEGIQLSVVLGVTVMLALGEFAIYVAEQQKQAD